MKQTKNSILIVFAIIGVCAVLYGAWNLYSRHQASENARQMFSAPAPTGLPDIFHNASPPKQP
jgi:heme O synthase-like polyprenyltransferase